MADVQITRARARAESKHDVFHLILIPFSYVYSTVLLIHVWFAGGTVRKGLYKVWLITFMTFKYAMLHHNYITFISEIIY